MTNKTRFQIALIALIVSLVIFVTFTFVPQLPALKMADFIQGFAGGVAIGTFLGVLHYGNEIRRERTAV